MASNGDSNTSPETPRPRRGSFTSQTFTNLFGRSNSSSSPTAPFPGPITTAVAQDQRRRMSLSTVGLSATSPSGAGPFNFPRRGSVSTAASASDSIDENAIDDEEGMSQSTPSFTRRMSFGAQALRNARGGTSPGTGRNPSYSTPSNSRKGQPPQGHGAHGHGPGGGAEDNAYRWSEQFRSRAESAVSQAQRPSFGALSMKPTLLAQPAAHERAKSISDMPAPPAAAMPAEPAPARPERRKPDAFQERILKGDFYMD